MKAGIIHHGDGLQSGHYTYFVMQGEKLYHFNDSAVLENDFDSFDHSLVYVVTYEKIEIDVDVPLLSSSPSREFDSNENASEMSLTNELKRTLTENLENEDNSKKARVDETLVTRPHDIIDDIQFMSNEDLIRFLVLKLKIF